MGDWMDSYLKRLVKNREENQTGGGIDRIEVQHGLGKLTARERIDRLVDPGSFEELGSLVRDPYAKLAKIPKPSPSDGVVMGMAKIKGRLVAIYSLDFTVMSGSIGDQGVWKIAELVQMAGQEQIPLIGILDSAGSRLAFKGGFVGLNGLGRLVRTYCLFSGVIPQITLVLGPCTGPLAQIAALSDFLIMNQKTGFLWLGGEIESEEAGSAEFHMTKSGQCDLLADSDEEALKMAGQLLNFIPQNCWKNLPPLNRPMTRKEEKNHFSMSCPMIRNLLMICTKSSN